MALPTARGTRMVRSMQLVLDIEAPKSRPAGRSRSSAPDRLCVEGSPSFNARWRRQNSGQAPSFCRDCGGPLVSGEGQVVCVVCGLTRAA